MEPLTGWFRDGYCTYDKYDAGVHVVCGTMTKEVSYNPDPDFDIYTDLLSHVPKCPTWNGENNDNAQFDDKT